MIFLQFQFAHFSPMNRHYQISGSICQLTYRTPKLWPRIQRSRPTTMTCHSLHNNQTTGTRTSRPANTTQHIYNRCMWGGGEL